ncbi:MAG: SgcJ/EcaC family oxidoreductase [Acidobacteriota bacterium]|nr:SgcJ/EcaC family oxidoreductase [Acidobacteriota bacterium]
MREDPGDAAGVLRAMEQAWNKGNAAAFAAVFAEDADLVNFYGMRLRGRKAIAALYDMLFRSVFQRSRLECTVAGTRQLCDTVVLLHVRMVADTPLGALAGEHESMASVLLQRQENCWRIVALHNTLVSEGAERPVAM